jgi:AhpD family alkylhydroperoxidase
MTRIEGVPRSEAGALVRLVYRMARRKAKQIAGASRDLRVEPIEIYAHAPRLMLGYGIFEQSVASKPRVDEHLRALAVLKSAVMQGCEFCQDIGSHEARRAGVSDQQLLDLHRYRDSERFDEAERLILDLAVGMTVTPVQVSDELFAALHARFEDSQLVELVNLIALENLRSRFNAAFSIGSAGFSEGMVCALAQTEAELDARSTPAAGAQPAGSTA